MSKTESFCPLTKENCKNKVCQWWLDGAKRCAVALIPPFLEAIHDMIDQK